MEIILKYLLQEGISFVMVKPIKIYNTNGFSGMIEDNLNFVFVRYGNGNNNTKSVPRYL